MAFLLPLVNVRRSILTCSVPRILTCYLFVFGMDFLELLLCSVVFASFSTWRANAYQEDEVQPMQDNVAAVSLRRVRATGGHTALPLSVL